MRANFQKQFNNLREVIRANVAALKGLIKQFGQLSDLINTLSNDTQIEIKNQLESIKNQISESISILAEQTQKLFESYDKLVEEVFGKQK